MSVSILEKIKWTAIIPARSGSKGLKNKNTKNLLGKPLYAHAVDFALECGADKVIITTDINEIIEKRFEDRVKVVRRKVELAGDITSMEEVLLDVLKDEDIQGTVVLLQPTSPLRKKYSMEAGLKMYNTGMYSIVMSVNVADSAILKFGFKDENSVFSPINNKKYCFMNRQQLPKIFKPNGAIYIFNAEKFVENNGWVLDVIGMIEMTINEGLDIDNIKDFENCERIMGHEDGN